MNPRSLFLVAGLLAAASALAQVPNYNDHFSGWPAGTDPREVAIGDSPGVGRTVWRTLSGLLVVDVLRELLAGLEEEGCTARVVRVNSTLDLGMVGLTAARLAGSGIGIGT